MRNTGFFTIIFVLTLTAFGCGSTASISTAENKAPPPQIAAGALDDTEGAPFDTRRNTAAASKPASPTNPAGHIAEDKSTLDQGRTSTIDTSPTDRKIIRNAELSLEVDRLEEPQRRITAIAESSGGFVVESQQSSSEVRGAPGDIVSLNVRVPAQKFGEALEQIRQTSKRVLLETVKGDDVTEEFIDVEARLKAKKALEQQFMEIMKRANSVDEALNVQRQLGDVRSEIEKIEGRKRFLENQSSLSTIKVRLQTPMAFSTNSSGFSYRLLQSLGTGLDFALNFVLGLVTFVISALPFALFIGLPFFLAVRYAVKQHKKTRTVGEIVKEEINNG